MSNNHFNNINFNKSNKIKLENPSSARLSSFKSPRGLQNGLSALNLGSLGFKTDKQRIQLKPNFAASSRPPPKVGGIKSEPGVSKKKSKTSKKENEIRKENGFKRERDIIQTPGIFSGMRNPVIKQRHSVGSSVQTKVFPMKIEEDDEEMDELNTEERIKEMKDCNYIPRSDLIENTFEPVYITSYKDESIDLNIVKKEIKEESEHSFTTNNNLNSENSNLDYAVKDDKDSDEDDPLCTKFSDIIQRKSNELMHFKIPSNYFSQKSKITQQCKNSLSKKGNLREGNIGSIRIYKSGKAEWIIDDMRFTLENSENLVPLEYQHVLASMKIDEKEKTGSITEIEGISSHFTGAYVVEPKLNSNDNS